MPLEAYLNTYAGNPLDRAGDRRADAAWIAAQAAAPGALALALWNGRPLVETAEGGGVRIAYLDVGMAGRLAGGSEALLFLGLWKDAPVFALDLEGTADPAEGPLEGLGRFEEIRSVTPIMPPAEAAITATAKALFEWLRRHRHCAACGEITQSAEAGWKRLCPACGAEHFPRTDPVVIMLAVHGERCLLGRQASWPPMAYSALAGFVEAGETIEEACARELFEEARLRATRITYHSSQPWPFPGSLMIGLIAQVENDDAVADQVELEEVRWFTRDEARALMRGELHDARPPPPLAIAHHLIKAWAEAGES
jgi:NAD+ diphosphatase